MACAICRGSFSSRQHDVLSGRYTLGPEKEKKVFASRYKLLLRSEAELQAKLLRELASIAPAAAFRFQLSAFRISAFQRGT